MAYRWFSRSTVAILGLFLCEKPSTSLIIAGNLLETADCDQNGNCFGQPCSPYPVLNLDYDVRWVVARTMQALLFMKLFPRPSFSIGALKLHCSPANPTSDFVVLHSWWFLSSASLQGTWPFRRQAKPFQLNPGKWAWTGYATASAGCIWFLCWGKGADMWAGNYGEWNCEVLLLLGYEIKKPLESENCVLSFEVLVDWGFRYTCYLTSQAEPLCVQMYISFISLV